MNIIHGKIDLVFEELDKVLTNVNYPKIEHGDFYIRPYTKKIILGFPRDELQKLTKKIIKKYSSKEIYCENINNFDSNLCITTQQTSANIVFTSLIDDFENPCNLPVNILSYPFYTMKNEFNHCEIMIASIEGLSRIRPGILFGEEGYLNYYAILWDKEKKLHHSGHLLIPSYTDLLKCASLEDKDINTSPYFYFYHFENGQIATFTSSYDLRKNKEKIFILPDDWVLNNRYCCVCKTQSTSRPSFALCKDLYCDICLNKKNKEGDIGIRITAEMIANNISIENIKKGVYKYVTNTHIKYLIESLYYLDEEISKCTLEIYEVIDLLSLIKERNSNDK